MPYSQRSRRILTAALLALALADATAALAVKRRAFVTSITGTGDIASWPGASGATTLDKADAVCRARATAGSLPNAGTYRAWLSTATPGAATDAYCHVQGLSGQKHTHCNGATLTGGGPWYLSNGITTWSGTLDQLTTAPGIIYRSVALDELQQPVLHDWETQRVWTGTFEGGQGSVLTCDDWTSASVGGHGWTGDALGSARLWTNSGGQDCIPSVAYSASSPGRVTPHSRLGCPAPSSSPRQPAAQATSAPGPRRLALPASTPATPSAATWPRPHTCRTRTVSFRGCRPVPSMPAIA